MPGQSGTVMTLDSLFSLLGKLLPFGIGLAAQLLWPAPCHVAAPARPDRPLIGIPRHGIPDTDTRDCDIGKHDTQLLLYLHIPFCTHRCAYCDFNTYARQEALIPAYVEALCNEIRFVAGSAPERLPVHTIFFGGGTPSLLTPQQFEQILQTIRASLTLFLQTPQIPRFPLETSLEANPGTVTLALAPRASPGRV